MSEWLDWGIIVKAATIAGSTAGLVRSWRHQWAGPKGIALKVQRRWHLEEELFTTSQDRDYYRARANYYRDKCIELMTDAREQAALASSLESSIDSGDAPPPRPLPPMTSSPRSSRRQSKTSPTPNE